MKMIWSQQVEVEERKFKECSSDRRLEKPRKIFWNFKKNSWGANSRHHLLLYLINENLEKKNQMQVCIPGDSRWLFSNVSTGNCQFENAVLCTYSKSVVKFHPEVKIWNNLRKYIWHNVSVLEFNFVHVCIVFLRCTEVESISLLFVVITPTYKIKLPFRDCEIVEFSLDKIFLDCVIEL